MTPYNVYVFRELEEANSALRSLLEKEKKS